MKGSSHQGYMNNYGGGGFVAPFSKDYATTMAIIDDLKQNLWIDRGTRAVFLDFTVYNANLNLFCQVRYRMQSLWMKRRRKKYFIALIFKDFFMNYQLPVVWCHNQHFALLNFYDMLQDLIILFLHAKYVSLL